MSERRQTGEALQAAAPLDPGPPNLPLGSPPLPAAAGGAGRRAPSRAGRAPRAPPFACLARREPLPALAADLSRGAGAAPAGLDYREAPAGRREGCGGARWTQSPGGLREAGAQAAATHCSVAAVEKKGDKRWDERQGRGTDPAGGAWNAGFRSLHSVLWGRKSVEVFNSGRGLNEGRF